jgi:hypothetical protein
VCRRSIVRTRVEAAQSGATELRGRVFLSANLEDHNSDTAAAQLQTYLQQLRTDRIGLMQLHRVRIWRFCANGRHKAIADIPTTAVTWTPSKR